MSANFLLGMPMNNSIPERLSPKEETLFFIRLFARSYHPAETERETGDYAGALFMQNEQALC